MARRRGVTNTNQDTQRVIQSSVNDDVSAAVRARLAMQLRAQKFTYDEIAVQCGYASRGAARNAIKRELQRYMSEAVIELLRAEEAMLYDDIQRAIYEPAMKGGKDGKPNLFAIDRLLATSKSRRELFGLDATKTDNHSENIVVVREVPPGYFGEVVSGDKALPSVRE